MTSAGWQGGQSSWEQHPWPPPSPRAYPPPPPPQRAGRDRWHTAGIAALAIASLAVRILLGIALDDDRGRVTPPPGESTMAPTHPSAGTAEARTLPPGTCLDRTPQVSVRVVPCSQSHVAEIVAVIRYEAPPGSAYPPILDLFRQSLDRCLAEFNAYTGTTPDQTPAGPFAAVPSQSEWNRGERLIVCYATGRNGLDLTAPLPKR